LRSNTAACTTRTAHTPASGSTPTKTTSVSATAAQPSSAPARTGTYQRGRARSKITQTTITGTEVPM
jgi:hypothetical protein